jgi:hypothetical protein
MENNGDLKLLDHAWRHFEFHAKQRLSLFNFCLVWAGLIIASWARVVTGDPALPGVGVVLGALLVISSGVFYRMDQRNSHLTKMSEAVLGRAESAAFPGQRLLFNTEDADAQLKRGLTFLYSSQWSHGQSLKVLFSLMAIVGAMGLGLSALEVSSAAPTEVHSAATPRTAPPSAKRAHATNSTEERGISRVTK